MTEVLQPRLVEALALLPLLHLPAKKGTEVAVVGPYAALMAAEVHRWPDVESIFLLEDGPKVQQRSKKYQTVSKLPHVDAVLLSPEQTPDRWAHLLNPGGVIQATTAEPGKFRDLLLRTRRATGNAMPWREHLPVPIYGVLGRAGTGPVRRYRQPPSSTRRLSRQYLPCLFTFGKDELALAFGESQGKLDKGTV